MQLGCIGESHGYHEWHNCKELSTAIAVNQSITVDR